MPAPYKIVQINPEGISTLVYNINKKAENNTDRFIEYSLSLK